MAYPTRIDVIVETEKTAKKGNRFKVMVNCIKRQDYNDVELANKEARKLHENELPHAQLKLCPLVYA